MIDGWRVDSDGDWVPAGTVAAYTLVISPRSSYVADYNSPLRRLAGAGRLFNVWMAVNLCGNVTAVAAADTPEAALAAAILRDWEPNLKLTEEVLDAYAEIC